MSYFDNPKAPTLAKTYSTDVSSSVTVTFNSGSTSIVASAITKGVFMKWGGTASSSSFDEFIPADKTAIYVIPNNSAGTPYTSAQFIQEAASAHLVVLEK